MQSSLVLALLAGAAAFQSVPPKAFDEIVVTGKRLGDTGAALQVCIARRCPVIEDINASLAHAENLLLHGNYRGARTVLRHSIGRNQDEARRYPEPVSDLYRANALVASHLGFDRDYRTSTLNIYRTLKAGIQAEDHRHLQAKMEIAAMTAKTKGPDSAERAYLALAQDAWQMGRKDIAGMAEVRAAMMVYVQVPEAGKARLKALIERTSEPFVSNYGKLFYASILRGERRDAEADKMLREITANLKKPLLIYAPYYELSEQDLGTVAKVPDPTKGDFADANVLRRPNRNFERMWIDVAFLVQPDGRVADVEVVRSENDTFWAEPLLKSIKGRRYTAMAGSLPYPRLERYTYTAAYDTLTGSRLAARSPLAKVEYLDLALPEAEKAK